MITFEAVCQMVQLEPFELERWIAQRWVLPESEGANYVFDELDVARVRLIVEMHRDLAVGEDAMSIVLRLLDQLYATRRQMRSLLRALETLPEDHRAGVLRHLGES
ncbi:MAG: chaperone modulator CbpM [Stellaceae bacterium]